MKFVSSRNRQRLFSLKEAVFKGLAPDGGLFMPAEYPVLYDGNSIDSASAGFAGLAFQLAKPYLEEDLDDDNIRKIITASFDFDIPLRKIKDNIYVLELFHGPTLAFKDIGARFMARLMTGLNSDEEDITILVATSGDTGGAVANGFHGLKNTKVVVLYPRGRVSKFQEKQFASLDGNIHSLAVEGSFDDCQRLVKEAFMDDELRKKLRLTSANSINIGRWLPQSFYYTWGLLKWMEEERGLTPAVSVPGGNYGNLAAAMLAHKSGMPLSDLIAASNRGNNVVPLYLRTGIFRAQKTVHTITNAMDVGNPSNFERIEYMGGSYNNITKIIRAYEFDDREILDCIERVFNETGYILDPHSATGYMALEQSGLQGYFTATAHPVKFLDVLPAAVRKMVRLPAHFKESGAESSSLNIPASYKVLRDYLLKR
ncbi:MAG: threonine synthase [Bacteroidales bacterium]|nr:threonine synthase [Bacteroidales bacterium]